ncbi:hypothetical protein [Pasteurella sp. PK-2025]|uniref:hypothetical protein n=1 Tax=unclassified Pasteurella TaxID=2621516 RepID=UPI003C72329B
MKLITKLATLVLSLSVLLACEPKGPSPEQIAAEQQAKALYDSAKMDYDKYQEWRKRANDSAHSMSSLGLKMKALTLNPQDISSSSYKEIVQAYEDVAKKLNDVADELTNLQFNDPAFDEIKTKGSEAFKTLATLTQESIPYLTKEMPTTLRNDMVNRRKQAVNIINNHLVSLENNVIKSLKATANKYHELHSQNEKLRKE